MKKIDEIELNNKTVVIRLDYNVPVKDGIISDNSKITKTFFSLFYVFFITIRKITYSFFFKY